MIPRRDIVDGMQVVYRPTARPDVRIPVTVLRKTDGPCILIKFADATTKLVLPADLELAPKRPSARRKFALRSVVAEYQQAGGEVSDSELEQLRQVLDGRKRA